MIVDHEQFDLVEDFAVIEPERLQREIDTVIVVEGRHPDGQFSGGHSGRRVGDRRHCPRSPSGFSARERRVRRPPDRAKQAPGHRGVQAFFDNRPCQKVDHAAELIEAGILQRDRRCVARELRDGSEPMVGQVAGVQIAFHEA